jgi:hypothetical protein
MLKKSEFVRRILDGAASPRRSPARGGSMIAGFEGFEELAIEPSASEDLRFAQLLLESSGFPLGRTVARDEVVLGEQKTLPLLPDKLVYWPKADAAGRPFHILLFDLELTATQLREHPFVQKYDQLEDIIYRLIQDALEGFRHRGEQRTADREWGLPTETLCVVSVQDDRPVRGRPRPAETSRRVVCFGTKCVATDALEIFTLREEVREWPDAGLAKEHLEQVYARHFSKLGDGPKWQEAFISGEERKKADALLRECARKVPDKKQLEVAIKALLEEIAQSFGLSKKKGKDRYLSIDPLPDNHSIGVKPAKAREQDFENEFQGLRIFDADERLLGYIVYVLDGKADAERLSEQLEEHNHFHNVLVIYPDQNDTKLELWQGSKPLRGRLLKGTQRPRFDGTGGVVQLLASFFIVSRSSIEDSPQLATELAWRAQHLKAIAVDVLDHEQSRPADQRPLRDLLHVFNVALAALDEQQFADAYAQTITYGLLAARWFHSDEQDVRFARKNIDTLLPSTSPFLQDLFKQLINERLDTNLLWLIDDIMSLLWRTMVGDVFFNEKDPSIHFYERFLDAYDRTIRAERGVYYTPDEVVEYIVQSVHSSLRERLNLPLGLADTTTWSEFVAHRDLAVPSGLEHEPVIQILDPAAGTGTFLLHIIDVIHKTMMAEYQRRGLSPASAQDEWKRYVRQQLLPRLNGFELMMAPYIVCHLRLGLALQETGFTFAKSDRLRVFLTNTLEQHRDAQIALIGEHVAEEAAAAEQLKRGSHITVIVGNPPYSKMSGNLSEDAIAWVEPFRYVAGEKIREKGALAFELNIQDDYVKFWGFLLGTLDRVPAGVGAYITNGRFLGSRSLRGLRWSMTQRASSATFIDLGGQISENRHIDAEDENVFNISQGVAITVLTREPGVAGLAEVRYARITGTRSEKLHALAKKTEVTVQPVPVRAPFHEFTPLSEGEAEYNNWPSLEELMPFNSGSVITSRDNLCIDADAGELLDKIKRFANSPKNDTAIQEAIGFSIKKSWDAEATKSEIRAIKRPKEHLARILYRPFDVRYIFYLPSLLDTPSRPVATSMFEPDNWVLLTPRIKTTARFSHVLVARIIAEKKSCSHDRATQMFPLYRHVNDLIEPVLPNLNRELLAKGSARKRLLAKSYEEWLFFVYAVMSSEGYRSRYGGRMLESYPRVPPIANLQLFSGLAKLGGRLAELHSQDPANGKLPEASRYVGPRSPVVEAVTHEESTIWIDKQKRVGFTGVTEALWSFEIGGYPVLQKWLKDRKQTHLVANDIRWLNHVIDAVEETLEVTHKIDRLIEKHGGWPAAFAIGADGC